VEVPVSGSCASEEAFVTDLQRKIDRVRPKPAFRTWLPNGIAIGAALGAAIDNVAAGIAVGLLGAGTE
jgi:hypothetical protein